MTWILVLIAHLQDTEAPSSGEVTVISLTYLGKKELIMTSTLS